MQQHYTYTVLRSWHQYLKEASKISRKKAASFSLPAPPPAAQPTRPQMADTVPLNQFDSPSRNEREVLIIRLFFTPIRPHRAKERQEERGERQNQEAEAEPKGRGREARGKPPGPARTYKERLPGTHSDPTPGPKTKNDPSSNVIWIRSYHRGATVVVSAV
jgi:hypothetical protein